MQLYIIVHSLSLIVDISQEPDKGRDRVVAVTRIRSDGKRTSFRSTRLATQSLNIK